MPYFSCKFEVSSGTGCQGCDRDGQQTGSGPDQPQPSNSNSALPSQDSTDNNDEPPPGSGGSCSPPEDSSSQGDGSDRRPGPGHDNTPGSFGLHTSTSPRTNNTGLNMDTRISSTLKSKTSCFTFDTPLGIPVIPIKPTPPLDLSDLCHGPYIASYFKRSLSDLKTDGGNGNGPETKRAKLFSPLPPPRNNFVPGREHCNGNNSFNHLPDLCGSNFKSCNPLNFNTGGSSGIHQNDGDKKSGNAQNKPADNKDAANTSGAPSPSQSEDGEFRISDPNITTVPPLWVINDNIRRTGNYQVANLIIRHNRHGLVQFLGNRNLRAFGPHRDFGQIVQFRHGVAQLNDNLAFFPILIILHNITRQDFAKQRNKNDVTDQELEEIVHILELLMNASHSSYSPEAQTWVLRLDAPGSTPGDGNGDMSEDAANIYS